MKRRELRFRIDAFTPETLPMERLAEYMAKFAVLLGETERVHFVKLEKSSAVLVASAEPQAGPKVDRRLLEIRAGTADQATKKAVRELDDMLANDNAIGQILDDQGGEIINFPGRTRPQALAYGPFREDGVLEGVIFRLGGKDQSVPVWLEDQGAVHKCNTSIALAKELSHYYLGPLLRVKGSGRWLRETSGDWRMMAFDIKDYEVLDDTPLAEVVKRLQAAQGSEWGEDPVDELMRLRNGESLN